jgi:hypothetical protein
MSDRSNHDTYLATVKSVLADVERIPESERDTPGVCGYWTLRDMMAHLAFWDGWIANSLASRKRGEQPEPISEPFDVINAREHEKRAHLSWDEVMAEQNRVRELVLPLMIDPGEDPGWSIYEHWQEHGEQIAAFAERVAGSKVAVRA